MDTPGLRTVTKGMMNRHLNRVAGASLQGVDCIVLLIAASGWTKEDEYPLQQVVQQGIPVILAMNKIDQLKNRDQLLPLIERSRGKMEFTEIVPVSARTGANVDRLEKAILNYLPPQPLLYPRDQITDRGERFLAAELIREQIFRGFQQEIPYATAVSIASIKAARSLGRAASNLGANAVTTCLAPL